MICHKHLGLDKIKTKLPISPLRSAPPANSQLIKLFGVIPNCNLCLTLYPSTDPFSSIFRITSEYNFLPALASVQATRNRCPNGSLSPQKSKPLKWTTRPSMICPCPMLLWPNPLWARYLCCSSCQECPPCRYLHRSPTQMSPCHRSFSNHPK